MAKRIPRITDDFDAFCLDAQAVADDLLKGDRNESAEKFTKICHDRNLASGDVCLLREEVWQRYALAREFPRKA